MSSQQQIIDAMYGRRRGCRRATRCPAGRCAGRTSPATARACKTAMWSCGRCFLAPSRPCAAVCQATAEHTIRGRSCTECRMPGIADGGTKLIALGRWEDLVAKRTLECPYTACLLCALFLWQQRVAQARVLAGEALAAGGQRGVGGGGALDRRARGAAAPLQVHPERQGPLHGPRCRPWAPHESSGSVLP